MTSVEKNIKKTARSAQIEKLEHIRKLADTLEQAASMIRNSVMACDICYVEPSPMLYASVGGTMKNIADYEQKCLQLLQDIKTLRQQLSPVKSPKKRLAKLST